MTSWESRARNWAARCSTTLPGCPFTDRLILARTRLAILEDIDRIHGALLGALCLGIVSGMDGSDRMVAISDRLAEGLALLGEHEETETSSALAVS